MTTSQAIEAYDSLSSAMTTRSAKSEEERSINTEKFERAFKEVLDGINIGIDTPMETRDERSGHCKVLVLPPIFSYYCRC
jgi:hypothetical protein